MSITRKFVMPLTRINFFSHISAKGFDLTKLPLLVHANAQSGAGVSIELKIDNEVVSFVACFRSLFRKQTHLETF